MIDHLEYVDTEDLQIGRDDGEEAVKRGEEEIHHVPLKTHINKNRRKQSPIGNNLRPKEQKA
jgi:hypothetical protein